MGEEDPEKTTEDGTNGEEKKASPERREGLLERAKKGIEKVKEMLLGKTMLKNREDGSIRIVKDVTSRKAEEEEFNVDDLIDEGEEVSVEMRRLGTGRRTQMTRGVDRDQDQDRRRVATAFWGNWRRRKRMRNWKRGTRKIGKGKERM